MERNQQINTFEYNDICERIEKYWRIINDCAHTRDYWKLLANVEVLKYYILRKHQIDHLMELRQDRKK